MRRTPRARRPQMARAIIDARGALKHTRLVVEIRHMREYKIRIYLAVRIIRLAAWIAGVGLDEKHQIGVVVSLGDAKPADKA